MLHQRREEKKRHMDRRVAIVTGASSGIGAEVAREAAGRGYAVVLAARRGDRIEALAAEIVGSGGVALAVIADLSVLEDQRRLVDEVIRTLGRIDILVNNAAKPLPELFQAATPEDLWEQWSVNVAAAATMTRLALPELRRSRGTVINIGSSIGRFAVPTWGNYAPTKIAIAGLNDALRRELRPLGVRVCLVEPGPIATEFWQRAGNPAGNNLAVPAATAARRIVELFEHPRRRIVIPGWLAPLLSIASALPRPRQGSSTVCTSR